MSWEIIIWYRLGEIVSENTGIPFRDLMYKLEDYRSQKGLDPEERAENVDGKIGCREDNLDADRVLVIDDVATTCATLSSTAQALKQVGAEAVTGLVIGRNENFSNLKFAGAATENI